MLGDKPLPAGVRRTLQDKLSTISLEALRMVASTGTRIAVIDASQTPLDVGVIRFQDVKTVAATVARAFATAGESLRPLEEKLGQARPESPEAADLRADLDEQRQQAEATAWNAIGGATHGSLEKYGTWFPPDLFEQVYSTPSTLDQIAGYYGHESPQRKKAFVAMVQELNGHGLPTDEPFLVTSSMVFPSHLHWEKQKDGSEIPRMMDGHDAGSLENWRNGSTRAQYWFQQDRNTVVLRSSALDQNEEGIDTVVHEFGHAYDAALQRREPRFYGQFQAAWQGVHEQGRIEKSLPTRYSRSNPQEFFADAFALWFSPRRDDLIADHQVTTALLRAALQQATRVTD